MKKSLLMGLLFLGACCSKQLHTTTAEQKDPGIAINGKLFATLYQQKAAEYRALCFQAYNIAQLRLDMFKPGTNKPTAIITDIDETVLDNSPYEAHQTLQGKDYDPVSWLAWTAKAAADTIPGAATFLKYAATKGCTIFYITNRGEKEMESTLVNLRKFNLPNADAAHFMYKQATSSKESRREAVASNYEIVLLLGDNLGDFSSLFDKQPMKDVRMENTNNAAVAFGNRFIVLPNPVYGDWESSLFKFSKLTQGQKDSVIRADAKTY